MVLNLMRLKAERVASGLTQAQIAHQLGISRASYAKREAGLVHIDANTLAKIADILGYSKDQLGIFFDSSFKK